MRKKRNLQFFFTIIICRLIILLMKSLGRRSGYFPGKVARVLCPSFLSMLGIPTITACVSGTNGKTSISNMIGDFLEKENKTYVLNRTGSNMIEGVISSLLTDGTSFFGKSKKEYGIFEVDERSSKNIYSQLTPNFILISNLFRDTIRREANADYIFDHMDNAIPKKSKMILNADDALSKNLAAENERVFYSLSRLAFEKDYKPTLLNDMPYHINSEKKLEYTYQRYHHIGVIADRKEKIKYKAIAVDEENDKLEINVFGKLEKIHLQNFDLTGIYNRLASFALLSEMKFSSEKIDKAFEEIKLISSRYEEIECMDKKIILFLSKGNASVAGSRVVEAISEYKGRTAVIIMNEEEYDLAYYNPWFFEIDYRPFKKDNIVQIITGGYYSKEFAISMLLSDVDASKIRTQTNHLKTAEMVDLAKVDNIFIVYGLDTIVYKDSIKNELISRITGVRKNEN